MRWKLNWKETRLPESNCPYCKTELNGASSPEGATPEPGHFSICKDCASIVQFGENLTLLPVTDEELEAVRNEDPGFMKKLEMAQNAVRELHKRRTLQ